MLAERLLEITVESLDTALAAERGGADRLELCAELVSGGVTPPVATIRKIHEEVEIPVFAIIRPRAGNFVYTDAEFAVMLRSIATVRDLALDGVALGILQEDGTVDIERTRELVEAARPLDVTFHRAFDHTPDLLRALEHVLETGATRILTSGGAAGAPEGAGVLRKLVGAAAQRITIVPGAGLHSGNIAKIAAETQAREFHSGLGTVLPYGSNNLARFESEIHTMKRCLQAHSLAS
ncbi:MAG TPA: copper homeostasis protein CutC [Dongiaceae bacterium]|nr:copper homeostasis protein CutC [Dongiaceae bacterium]